MTEVPAGRSLDWLRDELLKLLSVSTVRAVALGGSTAAGQVDIFSDVDIFAFCTDADLMPLINAFDSRMRTLFGSSAFIVGPTLSYRFGIKFTLVVDENLFAEVFFNSPTIFAQLPMTRRMRFTSEQGKRYFEEEFGEFVSKTKKWRHELNRAVFLDGIFTLRSLLKCLSRQEWHGFNFYLFRFQDLITAIQLENQGIVEYDHYLVERKLTSVMRSNNIDEPQLIKIDKSRTPEMVIGNYYLLITELQKSGFEFPQTEYEKWLTAVRPISK
jgi:hypothetical protein